MYLLSDLRPIDAAIMPIRRGLESRRD